MKKLKRSQLKPGMRLKNKISGKVGEVRGKLTKLLGAHQDYVAIRLRGPQKCSYPYWDLENVEIVG